MRVERTIEIAAPAGRVYEVVMDPRQLKDWVTIHHALQDAPSGALREGSELTQTLKLAGTKFTVRWRVVQNEPEVRVVWEGHGPVRSRARVIYELAGSSNGTRFSYVNEFELPGGPLGKMGGRALSRLATKEADGSLARLRRLVEER